VWDLARGGAQQGQLELGSLLLLLLLLRIGPELLLPRQLLLVLSLSEAITTSSSSSRRKSLWPYLKQLLPLGFRLWVMLVVLVLIHVAQQQQVFLGLPSPQPPTVISCYSRKGLLVLAVQWGLGLSTH
jgi:hypothetical protein